MMDVEKTLYHEVLQKSEIKQITFVTPAYNEAKNLTLLTTNLNTLTKPEKVTLRVVISNNGSTDNTSDVAKNSFVHNVAVPIARDSVPRSIGSARRKGLEAAIASFHKDNPQAKPEEHIIVCFDADTQVPSTDFLYTIQDVFSKDSTMVAYDPLEWISKSGSIDKKYKIFQDQLSKIRLRGLFKAYERNLSHYINKPQLIFAGACMLIRESALKDETGTVLNFEERDRVGEDVRFSLQLQQKLQPFQIVKDKRLVSRTSARGLETKDGKISRLKGIQRLLHVLFVGEHVPESTKLFSDEKLSSANLNQANLNDGFNTSLVDVVGDFIRESDKKTYKLEANEYIDVIMKLSKKRFRI